MLALVLALANRLCALAFYFQCFLCSYLSAILCRPFLFTIFPRDFTVHIDLLLSLVSTCVSSTLKSMIVIYFVTSTCY